MITTRTVMVPQQKRVIICDSCGHTIANVNDMVYLGTQWHNNTGDAHRTTKRLYHLCHKCANDLEFQLDKTRGSVEGVSADEMRKLWENANRSA